MRYVVLSVGAVSGIALMLGFLLRFERVFRHFPTVLFSWLQGIVMTWAALSLAWLAALWFSRAFLKAKPEYSAARRGFLRFTRGVLFAGPAAVVGYGMFVERRRIMVTQQHNPIPHLLPPL